MPVATCKRSGKSPHNAAEPSPSCSITMVGASDGAGPIMRYSRSLSPIWRKPARGRVVMRIAAFAARRSAPSPPLWGRVGVGGIHDDRAYRLPPSLTLPHKGGGNDGASEERAERAVRQHFDFYRAATSRLRRFIIPQLEPLDLAGRGFRQRVDGLDPARIFPDADLLLDVLFQRLVQAICLRAGAQHHERLGLEQAFAICLGHHGGLEHRRMGDQRTLDLERRYPDAGYLEHVVAAAAESIAPIGVANVFVAGAGPVPFECPPALAALVPIAFARRGRIHQEFADFAVRYVAAGLVDEPHLVTWHRTPRGAVLDVAGRVRQEDMQQLGRADAIENVDTKARLPGVAD